MLGYNADGDVTQALLTDYQSPAAETLSAADTPVALTVASPFLYDSGYLATCLADAPSFLWRLGDPGPTAVADSSPHGAGGVAVHTGSGALLGRVLGPSVPDRCTGALFDGASGYVYSSASTVNPQVFTLEAWFSTTTTTGGRLVGFGSDYSAPSASSDRHIYMTNAGALRFGCNNSGLFTAAATGPYNDGVWHHVAATLSGAGMALYVDGAAVATNANTAAQSYTGYWRVAYDTISGWPSNPTSMYFGGSVANVAVYPAALSSARIAAHYAARSGTYWGSAQYA